MPLSISRQTDCDELLDTDISACLSGGVVDILQELHCSSSNRLRHKARKFKFKVELKLPTLF